MGTKTTLNLGRFATLTAVLISIATLGADTACSDEPDWRRTRTLELEYTHSRLASPGIGITPNDAGRPSINPQNCAGRPIAILCVLGPVADPMVSNSCNQTKTYLEQQGCDRVSIIEVAAEVNLEEIKRRLQDQEIIILDSHGINEDEGFYSTDNDGKPVLSESDLNYIIPHSTCFIANACNSGAIDPINCRLQINICASDVKIYFHTAGPQLARILPYVVTGTRPEGKSCMIIPQDTEQIFMDACGSQGGAYSNEGATPASHELNCHIMLKESPNDECTQQTKDFSIKIAGPTPTEAELAQCQESALDGSPCEILRRTYSVTTTEATTKACCDGINLPGIPYNEHGFVRLPGGGTQDYTGISLFNYKD
jgi:hypothetical protein